MGRKQRTAAHGRALSAALQGNENGVRHGESTRTRRTPENAAWQNMKARCLRPSHPQYRHYGGRGISVCPQWMTFEGFLADVGRRPTAGHSLERIDNDRGYEPNNVRWATRSEQMQNTRRTKLSPEAVADVRSSGMTMAALGRKYGCHPTTIKNAKIGVSWS